MIAKDPEIEKLRLQLAAQRWNAIERNISEILVSLVVVTLAALFMATGLAGCYLNGYHESQGLQLIGPLQYAGKTYDAKPPEAAEWQNGEPYQGSDHFRGVENCRAGQHMRLRHSGYDEEGQQILRCTHCRTIARRIE